MSNLYVEAVDAKNKKKEGVVVVVVGFWEKKNKDTQKSYLSHPPPLPSFFPSLDQS